MRPQLQSRSFIVPACRSIVEQLETRQLMTATVVHGTAGNDTFNLSSLAAADTVTYESGGGHDTINIVTKGTVESVLGLVKLKNTGGGKWTINVNDAAVHADHTIQIGNGLINGVVSGTVKYAQGAVEKISVVADSRTASTAEITDCPAGVATNVYLVGPYAAKVGDSAGTLAAFEGSLYVQGGNASKLNINDLSDAAPHNITIKDGSVAGLTPNPIKYFGFSASQVLTGSGDKLVKVLGSSVNTTFTSFDGHVTAIVGESGNMAAVGKQLHLVNYFGKTDVTFDDAQNTTQSNYVLNAGDLSFDHGNGVVGSVTFDGRHSVTLTTGLAADNVTINNTNANDFNLDTGSGLDTVTQYASAGNTTIEAGNGYDVGDYVFLGTGDKGSLSKFAKTTTVHNASLVGLSDRDETLGHTYVLTTHGLRRDGVSKFEFANSYVDLWCGGGSDSFDGTSGYSKGLLVVGSGGYDKLVGTTGNDTLYGGAGNDTVVGVGGSDELWGDGTDGAIIGNDLLDTAGDNADTRAYGGAGDDTLRYDTAVQSYNIEHTVHTATLSGKVFVDVNSDGVMNGPDFGSQSVRVWIDANGNGNFDAADPFAYTDPQGNYTIRDIDAGAHAIKVSVPYGGHTTSNGGQPLSKFFLSGVSYALNIGVHN